MREWLSRRWQRVTVLAAVIGPGVITANVDNDAGGITTHSLAGATYGYRLLWVVIPVALALFVVEEMSSRLGVVTGKGLSDLVREEFGVKATVYLMFALLVTNLGNAMAEFAGLADALEIVHVPRWVSVPLGAASFSASTRPPYGAAARSTEFDAIPPWLRDPLRSVAVKYNPSGFAHLFMSRPNYRLLHHIIG